VRLFDPQTQQWRIHEADNESGFNSRPVIARSRTGASRDIRTNPGRASTFFVAWSGRKSPAPRSTGSKRFPPMAEPRGKLTGLQTLREATSRSNVAHGIQAR
jgi:hypothetical protein